MTHNASVNSRIVHTAPAAAGIMDCCSHPVNHSLPLPLTPLSLHPSPVLLKQRFGLLETDAYLVEVLQHIAERGGEVPSSRWFQLFPTLRLGAWVHKCFCSLSVTTPPLFSSPPLLLITHTSFPTALLLVPTPSVSPRCCTAATLSAVLL